MGLKMTTLNTKQWKNLLGSLGKNNFRIVIPLQQSGLKKGNTNYYKRGKPNTFYRGEWICKLAFHFRNWTKFKFLPWNFKCQSCFVLRKLVDFIFFFILCYALQPNFVALWWRSHVGLVPCYKKVKLKRTS